MLKFRFFRRETKTHGIRWGFIVHYPAGTKDEFFGWRSLRRALAQARHQQKSYWLATE